MLPVLQGRVQSQAAVLGDAEESHVRETEAWKSACAVRNVAAIEDLLRNWPETKRAAAASARINVIKRVPRRIKVIKGVPRWRQLMQGLSAAVAKSLAAVAPSLLERYRAEGRIKVDATIVCGGSKRLVPAW